MGFLDPKKRSDEDDALPGAAGLHLDLDLKRCPACNREVPPWQTECPDCGEVAVAPSEIRGSSFLLPGLRDEDEGEDEDQDGAAGGGEVDDGDGEAEGGSPSDDV